MTNDKVDEANHMDTAINIGDVIKQFDEFLAKEKDAVAKLKAHKVVEQSLSAVKSRF
jgi:hypothetical protein